MHKKNLLRVLFLTLLCLCMAIPALAVEMPNMEYEEFALGNIRPGMQLSAVATEFGQPARQEKYLHYSYGKKLKGIAYVYNDGFTVFALPTKRKDVSTVIGVSCPREGLATPSGFAVGKPFAMVEAKYGKVIPLPDGGLEPDDRAELAKGYNFYLYTYGPSVMKFKVDQGGIIRNITFMMGA